GSASGAAACGRSSWRLTPPWKATVRRCTWPASWPRPGCASPGWHGVCLAGPGWNSPTARCLPTHWRAGGRFEPWGQVSNLPGAKGKLETCPHDDGEREEGAFAAPAFARYGVTTHEHVHVADHGAEDEPEHDSGPAHDPVHGDPAT